MKSRFFCTRCGNEGIPIQRRVGKARTAGHLKKLYCLTCNREWNHVEIVENSIKYTIEDFYKEYSEGMFDEQGNRRSDKE